jgi:hypothetical protein
MNHRFRRTESGIQLHLEPTEYTVLERVPALVGSVGADGRDPATLRLDPPVHPEDDLASAEFSRLAGGEVAQGRSSDAARFERTLQQGSPALLTNEDAEAWVRTLGTARVAIVARSGHVHDDESFAAADRRDPNLLLVDYLGGLQEELVLVLLADVPGGPTS